MGNENARTVSELQAEINNLRGEISKLEEQIHHKKKEIEFLKFWKPCYPGEYFYYCASGEDIKKCEWRNESFDKVLYATGNVFKNFNDAEDIMNKRIILQRLNQYRILFCPDFRPSSKEVKYTVIVSLNNGKFIPIKEDTNIIYPSVVYFDSEETANKVSILMNEVYVL